GGIAYLFRGSDGALLQTYQNPFPGTGDRFGMGTAIVDGKTAVIGAGMDYVNNTRSGAAFVFDLLSGVYQRPLYPPSPQSGSLFGVAAPYNEFVILGAQQENNGGRAYLFNPLSGERVYNFVDPVPGNGGIQYGARTAGYRNKVIVGAFADDTAGSNAGAAFLYETPSVATCVQSGTMDFQCAGFFSGTPTTDELRIQVVQGDSTTIGCDLETVESGDILVDFAVDCAAFTGLSSPSCADILDDVVSQFGFNITAQSNGLVEWKSVTPGQIELYGQVPFSVFVHATESGSVSDESYSLGTCPLVNLCDGVEGNEVGGLHSDGLAISFQEFVCPPTPTPTLTITPTPTYSPTPTFTNTATNTPTPTETPTFTQTPTSTPTSSPTNTSTQTPTWTSTFTPTPTHSPTPTNGSPSAPIVSISPSNPDTLADLICNATGSVDPEGATV
ncbi:MAG: FG-GAP repeat protein, partial [Candidatus Omnitrophica bacterium]|nr:FG-GAP repeat protein [Candidatus Omnitrophota bacterium]